VAGPALIVGLGNPGPEYARTRHNVGFRVVDRLCARGGERLRALKGTPALAVETRIGDRRVVLAEPTTYMNLSGQAIVELARYYKVEFDDIVVVHDELDLPFGTLRVKRGGGDAGHNGLKHITRALGTPDYARVRIGIGRPPGRMSAADYVLQPFSAKEEDEVAVLVEEAADIAVRLLSESVEAVQNSLHPGASAPPKERRIRKQVVVPAPVEQVWDAWTTTDGARAFFAPEANIELREDGPYELYFRPDAPPGERGAEGCKVISFEAPNRLSFTWNAPPEIPEVRRGEPTRVDVALRPAGRDRTRVALTHSGWGEGAAWDEAYAYFDRAWGKVLDDLRARFADGPLEWNA
jgi:PTH1 family peptidyl-tRNA hydrolase